MTVAHQGMRSAGLLLMVIGTTVTVHGSGLLMPVGPEEESSARILADAGTNAAASYRSATTDGKITNEEMRLLRIEVGKDIDAFYALEERPR